MRTHWLLLSAFVLFASCTADEGKNNVPPKLEPVAVVLNGTCKPSLQTNKLVALEKLVASPENYDGQHVTVSGYFYSSFERSALYPAELKQNQNTDAKSSIWLNGISVPNDVYGIHVTVSGEFSSKMKGHGNWWPGSMCVSQANAGGHS